MGRRVALLVASYHYQDAGLRRLEAPQHDAEALADMLRDPGVAGFEVKVLVNEPHHVVGEAIGDFYDDRRRDDLTLLYFTGHGLKDDQGRLYLAMTNTKRERLSWTALPAEQVNDAMEACRSGQKVLILDCCYSGAFPAGWAAKADPAVHTLERFGGKGRAVLTASDATQYSFEGEHLTGEGSRSVFTRCFIEGLRTGQADLDGDGDISLDDLYSYVYDRVVAEMPQQRPKKQENVEGRIVIARNVHWQLPNYVRSAIGSPISTDRLSALDQLRRLHQIGNDVVRTTVLDQVRLLADDDSRTVSAAATSLITSLLPEQARLALRYDQGCAALDSGRWDKAIAHFTAVTENDLGYRDVATKLEQARAERALAVLRGELAGLARAQRWNDVLAVWARIRKMQPDAADTDGTVALAREEVRRQREAEREAERAEAERQQRVHQLQAELRARGAAQDWPAVLAVNEQLTELDPTAADPDGVAKTARAHLEARQREAEEQVRRESPPSGLLARAQPTEEFVPQPTLLSPRLSVDPQQINLEDLVLGKEVRRTLKVHNVGAGALNARAKVSDPAWLGLERSGDALVVVAKPIVAGAVLGEVVITSDGGTARVPVRARVVSGAHKTVFSDIRKVEWSRKLVLGLVSIFFMATAIAIVVGVSARSSTSFAATAPWRFEVTGTDPCRIKLLDANGTEVRSQDIDLSDGRPHSFQIRTSGRFHYEVAEGDDCSARPLPGAGSTRLPVTVSGAGDSLSFSSPGRLTVNIPHSTNPCRATVYDSASGDELQWMAWTGQSATWSVTTGKREVYVGVDSRCTVSVT